MEHKYDVFISYSRKDIEEVTQLVDMLKKRIPTLNCWFDITGIECGDEEFDEKIVKIIDNSSYVLFALSKNSMESKWAKDEVMYAKNVGKKVIPVLLDGAKLEGWFLFKFGRVDCIDSTKDIQLDKMMKNISKWTKKPILKKEEVEQHEEESEEKVISDDKQPKPNYLKYILGVLAVVLGIVIGVVLTNNEPAAETSYREEQERLAEEQRNSRTQQSGVYTANGVTFKMIAVQGGSYTMGATSEQGSDADDDEKPAHSEYVSDFKIGETEVTQELWQAVMGSNPSYFIGDLQRPVEMVSWNDCQTFIGKLNQLTGQNFRLPTEVEWEYAASGGNRSNGYKYSGSNNVGSVAWYGDNSGSTTHPVKTKQPNELGIYDMSGNVYEWCQDKFSNDYNSPHSRIRVLRGGCYSDDARDVSVWCCYYGLDQLSPGSGLRLAL